MTNNVLPDVVDVQIVNPLNNQSNAVLVESIDKVRGGIVTLMYNGVIASSTLAVAIVSQDRDIDLVDATGFNVGESITNLAEASDSNFPVIIAKVGNVLTLDRLIDGNFPIGTVIDSLPVQMNVLGTPANPILYKVAPPPGEVWHLTRSMISMTHSTAGDMGKFGGITALTYGVQGRVFNDGVYTTFINWKTNGDMALTMYDVKFDSRSGGGGDFGTTGRFTFVNTGTVIELHGDTGDELQLLIQDDLTGLDTFKVSIQGHKK